MLGRQVSNTVLRLPVNARLPFRPAPFALNSHGFLPLLPQRFYATPGRPKKAVGEPSRPVKRATKRAARSTDTGEAGRQVRAKKATGTSTASKKTRKTTAKKTTTKKTTTRRARKPLTDEQKAVRDGRIAKAKITELKKIALSPPKRGARANAHAMLLREKTKGVSFSGSDRRKEFADNAKEVGREYRNLTPAELEHYNHLAVQHAQELQAAYKSWVESHSPETIQKANNARQQLNRKLKTSKGSKKYAPIKDERRVKRPVSAFVQYSINRHASGDFRNIALAERSKLIGQEWRALNDGEKKKYKDLQSQDQSRYISEHNDVFGHPPPQVAAAAA